MNTGNLWKNKSCYKKQSYSPYSAWVCGFGTGQYQNYVAYIFRKSLLVYKSRCYLLRYVFLLLCLRRLHFLQSTWKMPVFVFLSLVFFSLKLFWEGFCARGKPRVAKFSRVHTRLIHSNFRLESARTSWPVAWAGVPASLPSVTYVHQNSPYMGFTSAGKRSQSGHVSNVNLKPYKASYSFARNEQAKQWNNFQSFYLNIKKHKQCKQKYRAGSTRLTISISYWNVFIGQHLKTKPT